MFLKLVIWLLLLRFAASSEDGFTFNGFIGANLSRDGAAVVTPEGLLRLTNTTDQSKGHAFYPVPLHFRPSPTANVLTFSTTFVFGIVTEYSGFSSHGFAFFISPSNDLSTALGVQYLGLFNSSDNGDPSNHIVAVEFDTILDPEFEDINDNHVGIDVNSLISNKSSTAGYFSDQGNELKSLSLVSGEPMQVWVDYDGIKMQLNVTLSPLGTSKPNHPLLSSTINLSSIMLDPMFVGFSGSQGISRSSHYILGWSLKTDGRADDLNLSSLPSLPRRRNLEKKTNYLRALLPSSLSAIVLTAVALATFMVIRKRKFAELIEDWELQYGPHRFSYKDLYMATKGFADKELLGSGGFGRVYRGTLPASNMEVAVKRVSHESRQGMREFIAEIVSIGQLRHRNLVQLLGYCRRRNGELLLVYEFMPNGSLDKLLFNKDGFILDWRRRLQIIKGVASGLLYLHQGWEKVVIHRDIKASNVLLDCELNGRLGDFGLARLYDHGTDPHTTHVVGTLGYIAPELTRTGKATTGTDVFAFGVFLLEVACGRRPLDLTAPEEEELLVDWVVGNWKRGELLESCDRRLAGEYPAEEMELMLKLGLLCCHPLPAARPSMRQAMQILDGHVPLPEFSPSYLSDSIMEFFTDEGFDDNISSYPSSAFVSSMLSGGR
ncbi:L-type lectin-domain containing receptor kinase SIT2-like [Phoenix dactylifera]|uniref:non-specific serine/threonine protein kinase n=1 Tax=Phoenix dactylifera TaxID=42345 RepID=A0A8B7C2Q3_PHODC|nr:L-type lectin-domain containing receptor kinase SIT2-like [Phoenix dactylifera]